MRSAACSKVAAAAASFGRIRQKDLGTADQRGPVENLQAGVGAERGRPDAKSVAAAEVSPAPAGRGCCPAASSTIHAPRLVAEQARRGRPAWTPVAAAAAMSGEITSARLLKTVRYHGSSSKSPASRPNIHRLRGEFERRQTLRRDAIDDSSEAMTATKKLSAFGR